MGSRVADDFFREVYLNEIEQKHKLESADSFLAVVLMALSGIAVYDLRLLPHCSPCVAGYCFWGLSVLYCLAIIAAIASAVGSFLPRYKAYIAGTEDWNKYVKGMEDYHGFYHEPEEAMKRVDAELAALLRQQYVQASEINRTLAIKKMGWQTRTRYFIIIAISLMLINALPTCYIESTKADVQKVEVTKLP